VSSSGENGSSPFFGSFPTRGVWTALGLSRAQFLLIIAVSVVAFLFVDGPLWRQLEGNHFRRIVLSYLTIPAMIVAIQLLHREFSLSTLLGGTIVIGVIKLLLTALIVLLFSF
jgi:hypothetical protein